MMKPGVQNPHWVAPRSDERGLDRVEPDGRGDSLDRRDRVTLGQAGERQAGERRPAVDPDRAATARAEVAAPLGARQVEVLAQEVEQDPLGRTGDLHRVSVDRDSLRGPGAACSSHSRWGNPRAFSGTARVHRPDDLRHDADRDLLRRLRTDRRGRPGNGSGRAGLADSSAPAQLGEDVGALRLARDEADLVRELLRARCRGRSRSFARIVTEDVEVGEGLCRDDVEKVRWGDTASRRSASGNRSRPPSPVDRRRPSSRTRASGGSAPSAAATWPPPQMRRFGRAATNSIAMSTEPPHRLGSPPSTQFLRSKWCRSLPGRAPASRASSLTFSSSAAPPTVPDVEPSDRHDHRRPRPFREPSRSTRTTVARTNGWCASIRRSASRVSLRSIGHPLRTASRPRGPTSTRSGSRRSRARPGPRTSPGRPAARARGGANGAGRRGRELQRSPEIAGLAEQDRVALPPA